VGESTKNGKNRLASVMYIKATKKLGFPSKLKWLVMRLSIVAWKIVKISVIKTLVAGERLIKLFSPNRLPNAGSKITESSLSGRCKNIPKHSTKPTSDRNKILMGE